VRAVLDEVRWNTSTHCYYGFINGRRAWIVKDVLERGFAYPKMQSGEISYHPALISSKGMEELCAWIEKVAGAGSRKIEKFRRLSSTGVAMPDPLLLAVAGDDRIPVFGNRLTTRAKNFLQSYGRDNRVARR
jgi:hypothetical protein